jgi:hypothetical protein
MSLQLVKDLKIKRNFLYSKIVLGLASLLLAQPSMRLGLAQQGLHHPHDELSPN